MRIFFFVCAGLFLLLTGEAAAENTVMSRRTLDRANLFKSGDLSFSVSTDEHSPSFWSATVVKQKEERRVPINRSGVTLIFFPDEVLEVRNNRLPGRERWNIMQETIGEFEVIRRRPAEFFKPAPVRMTQEKSKDRSICVFQNGTFTLRLLPSLNGALYSMIDSVTGVEFFYGNPSGGVGKNAFEKLGFLELINRPRNASATAGVEFQPQLKKFPSGGGILKILHHGGQAQ